MPLNLTIAIPAKNEAKSIQSCLDAIGDGFASHVVVLESQSSEKSSPVSALGHTTSKTQSFSGKRKSIHIEAKAWIAAEAFVGPAVTIGDGAVVGAQTILFKDAEPNALYVGNPATLIQQR